MPTPTPAASGFPVAAALALLREAFTPRPTTTPRYARPSSGDVPWHYDANNPARQTSPRGDNPHGDRSAPEPRRKARTATGVSIKTKRSQMLRVLATRNPYKYGTKAWRTFALFQERDGQSVASIRAAAALSPDAFDLGYLRYSSRDGYIKLED